MREILGVVPTVVWTGRRFMSDFLIGGFKTIKQREIQAVHRNPGIAAAGRVCKIGARRFRRNAE
ncbi:hypothetical protein [Rhizobium sp. CF080]|uniref:hypothetical protein n=1 Tax=Rhizobium sp. (strain CF080) TaxID=1144310 RepID=UPI000565D310|nr:hypothetical protein [Rhizobium sp. CF080]